MPDMDDKLAQLHEQLDSIDCSTFLPGPRPNSSAVGAAQLGTRVHRRDRAALLQRLQSFRPSTWFGKPDSLSAPACAARGWCNTGHDLLTCEFCGRKLAVRLPANLASTAGTALIQTYTDSLSSSHEAGCPWATFTVHPCTPSFPASTNARLAADFTQRQQGAAALDLPPPVAAGTPGALLASTTATLAAAAGGGGGAGGAAAVAAVGGAGAAVSALSQALADLLHLQPKQLVAAPPSNISSSSSEVVPLLAPQQVPPLLSLLGWEVQQLLPSGSNTGHMAGASHPSILPHLITRAPSPDPQHQHQQQQVVAAAHCCLSCGLCGAKVPLWSYCKTGPLYLTTLARQAAAQGMLADAPRPAAVAAGGGGQASYGAAAVGDEEGAAAAAGGEAGCAAGTPPAARSGRVQVSRSSSLPPLPPSHHQHRGPSPQPSATGAAAAAGGAGGTSPAAAGGGGRQGTPGAGDSPTAAVAIALHQTIAGGALVSPRVSPTAGPFGAHATPAAAAGSEGDAGGLPAFGLTALAARESLVRHRSGSPGVTGMASPGDDGGGSRPAGKRGREEGLPSPRAALTGAAGEPADVPGAEEGGPNQQHWGGSSLHSSSSSKRPRRSFSPLDSSAVQAALGLADVPHAPTLVPTAALLQQPSLLGPAPTAAAAGGGLAAAGGDGGGGVAAAADVFDPVTAHRSWCPWVATPAHPVGTNSISNSSGSLEELQLATAPGWLQTLVAAAQQQAAFSSNTRAGQAHPAGRGGAGAGGGPSSGGVGMSEVAQNSDSGQVMARAKWVLQALGDV